MSFDESLFYKSGDKFIEVFQSKLFAYGVDLSNFRADHLCYRVETKSEYEEMKKRLPSIAKLLGESEVNGRPIATYRLNTAFKSNWGPIHLIELPAPKQNAPYTTGFEHIEFVISESFEKFCERYSKLSFSKPNAKILNQEIALKLDEYQAKFHYTPLDRVIEIEDTRLTDIIFDLDGTLIDSKSKIHEINMKTLEQILKRPISKEEVKQKFAPEFSTLFSNFGIAKGRIAESVELWSEISRTYSFEFFAEAKETLSILLKMGIRLHLWSARDEMSGVEILRKHDLQNIWTSFAFWESDLSKPEAKSFLRKNKHFDSTHSILIGDSSTDMMAAKNLGVIAAAALWDQTVDQNSLVAKGAELFLNSPRDIVDWAKRNRAES